MNRREILKSIFTLSALSAMGGCRHDFRKDPRRPIPSGPKLAIILQGPFAVVLRKNGEHGVVAFVPKPDPGDMQHEFRFLSPLSNALMTGCGSYRFFLPHHGLETLDREPDISHGFDNVRVTVDEWTPRPDDYFVTLELPSPERITYVPPLYPALFESGTSAPGRLGSAPLNHILEYTVRSADGVRLRQNPSGNCERQEHPPVSVEDILQRYGKYHQEMPESPDASFSQRPYIAKLLAQYSFVYFIGVGVPPTQASSPFSTRNRINHGIGFFNEKLLPAIYQLQPIPPDAKLKKIGKDVLQCNTGQSEMSMPAIRPAIWQYSMPQPHLRYISSTENCTSPVAMGSSRT
jgi:hypothetical protein